MTIVVGLGGGFLFCLRAAMTPTILDLTQADDTRDVVHRAVQALAEGKLVGVPTESNYCLAAAAHAPAAIEQACAVVTTEAAEPPLSIAVKSADEAADWAPGLEPLARRLARRCWPGPLAMLIRGDHPDGLVRQLPPAVQPLLLTAGRLRFRAPDHALLRDCLRLFAGPVVLAEPGDPAAPPATLADLLTACGPSVVPPLAIDAGPLPQGGLVSTVAIEAGRCRLLRGGALDEAALARLSRLVVLFVCTGNTCRSPMAEAIFRDLVARRLGCEPAGIEDRGVTVASAGLSAWGGSPASDQAVEVVAEQGIDLGGHASQPLTERLVRQADVIWTLTAAHRAAILAQFPDLADRVWMLSPGRRDVLDPIGGSQEIYRRCAAQIREHLESRIDTLGLASG